jgi:hypothetical protein
MHLEGPAPDEKEFSAEAHKFAKFHHVPDTNMFAIFGKQSTASRRAATYSALKRISGCDRFVFFGHGWKSGFQLGWNMNNVGELVEAFSDMRNCDVRPLDVVLYSCSTAEGASDPGDLVGTQGGIADAIRDCMVRRGIRGLVAAHRTAGHTTRNPYLVRISSEPDKSPQDPTEWYIDPKSTLWKTWGQRLSKTEFRYQAPFLSSAEIAGFLTRPENEFLRYFQRC